MAMLHFKNAENNDAAVRNVIRAMQAGRVLSLRNDREFKTSQMHTVFCKIRKKIANGQIPGVKMCDRWTATKSGIRYKEYWFEKV